MNKYSLIAFDRCVFCARKMTIIGRGISSKRLSSTDPEIDVQKLLNESQISSKTPLDGDNVNLDEHTGHFRSSLKTNIVPDSQPKPTKIVKQFDLSTKSVYMFSGDCVNRNPEFVNRLTKEPAVREVFEEASSIVGYDVLDLCLNGSREMLIDLKYSDIATLALNMGELAWIIKHRPVVHENLVMAGGIGVGEISAMVAAGALDLSQAVKLVKDRANAIRESAAMSESGLVLVYGSKKTNFGGLCEVLQSYGELGGVEVPVASVAMHLFACTKVIGGHMMCLKHLKSLRKEYHIKTFKYLDAPIALNTPIMKPSVDKFALTLSDLVFNDPKLLTASVYSGLSGVRYKRSDFAIQNSYAVKLSLLKQLTSAVKWETIANRLAQKGRNDEYPNYYILGSGQFLHRSFTELNGKAAQRCRNLKNFINIVEKNSEQVNFLTSKLVEKDSNRSE